MRSMKYVEEWRLKMRLSNKTKMMWRNLRDIPINDYGEIEERFEHFPIGTPRFKIWHWFEEEFDITIKDLNEVII